MYIAKSFCQQETNWVPRFVYNVNHKDMNVSHCLKKACGYSFSSNRFTFLQLMDEKKASGKTKLTIETDNRVNPH